MRELTADELEFISGGTYTDGEDIVVTGVPTPPPYYYPPPGYYYPSPTPPPYGGGGGGSGGVQGDVDVHKDGENTVIDVHIPIDGAQGLGTFTLDKNDDLSKVKFNLSDASHSASTQYDFSTATVGQTYSWAIDGGTASVTFSSSPTETRLVGTVTFRL